MLDHDRRAQLDHNMSDMYATPPERERPVLEDFQVFGKSPYFPYANYNNNFCDSDADADAAFYYSLMNARGYPRDENHVKPCVTDWTKEDTVAFIINTAHSLGYTDYQIPYYNFQVTGMQLLTWSKEDIRHNLFHVNIDPSISQRIADSVFDNIHADSLRPPTVILHTNESIPNPGSDLLDIGSYGSYKPDSSDEDQYPPPSPEHNSSDGWIKSEDEDRKPVVHKRPPGRPPGSGRKLQKKARSVSVPEFLRNMLLDPMFCPNIIKWEDYVEGKFRFVKPDEVAKEWGKLKENEGMTFEKFSRAMRYHYNKQVLVSVPTARLVYQFGVNGPNRETNDPNFVKLKGDRMALHS